MSATIELYVAWATTIVGTIEFYLGRQPQEKLTQKLEDFWLRIEYTNWHTFGLTEVQFALRVMTKLFGSTFFSLRRLISCLFIIAFLELPILFRFDVYALSFGGLIVWLSVLFRYLGLMISVSIAIIVLRATAAAMPAIDRLQFIVYLLALIVVLYLAALLPIISEGRDFLIAFKITWHVSHPDDSSAASYLDSARWVLVQWIEFAYNNGRYLLVTLFTRPDVFVILVLKRLIRDVGQLLYSGSMIDANLAAGWLVAMVPSLVRLILSLAFLMSCTLRPIVRPVVSLTVLRIAEARTGALTFVTAIVGGGILLFAKTF